MSRRSEQNEPLIVSGIPWRVDGPTLRCIGKTSRRVSLLPLIGQRLSYRCVSSGVRYCMGWFDCDGPREARFVPCVDLQTITSGKQCAECRARDGFDAIHQAHRGVPLKAALRAYLAQPHYLYVAVIADGTAKAGTATDCRRWIRLAEQGAAAAEYVARTRDGFAVRHLEDAISAELGVRQQVRGAQKVTALASPEPLESVRAKVAVLADAARRALGTMHVPEGTEILAGERWEIPACATEFFSNGRHTPFPERLNEREHGFRIQAALGSVVLAETSVTSSGRRYIADLSTLVGSCIELGDFSSALRPTQDALF